MLWQSISQSLGCPFTKSNVALLAGLVSVICMARPLLRLTGHQHALPYLLHFALMHSDPFLQGVSSGHKGLGLNLRFTAKFTVDFSWQNLARQ